MKPKHKIRIAIKNAIKRNDVIKQAQEKYKEEITPSRFDTFWAGFAHAFFLRNMHILPKYAKCEYFLVSHYTPPPNEYITSEGG